MTQPFSGIRVIDFSHVLAGPACSYYLGLLGAEVIKVESIGKGDSMRHRGGTDGDRAAEGMSTAYQTQAAGKKSIALDLATGGGLQVMYKLLESADVFVENHRPKSMEPFGLDESSIKKLNPKIIHCAMTGYGRGGDRENTPAYDVNIQAISGIMTLTGTPDMGPLRTGAPIMDYSVALAASFAISAALYERERTGEGTFVDVSMLETGFTLMSSAITDYLATGNAPTQRGNAANSRSPAAGNFPCKEGVISLGVNEEEQFRSLARVLGRDDWLADPRFVDRKVRKENAPILEAEVARILLTKTASEWEHDMMWNGVPAAQLRTLPESLELEQTKERRYLHTIPETGVQVPTLPFRIAGAKSHTPVLPPAKLGQHSHEILDALGYRESEISALDEQGAIWQSA